MHHTLRLPLLVVTVVALVACGAAPDAAVSTPAAPLAPSVTPAPSPTVQPTSTATATPQRIPTATPTLTPIVSPLVGMWVMDRMRLTYSDRSQVTLPLTMTLAFSSDGVVTASEPVTFLRGRYQLPNDHQLRIEITDSSPSEAMGQQQCAAFHVMTDTLTLSTACQAPSTADTTPYVVQVEQIGRRLHADQTAAETRSVLFSAHTPPAANFALIGVIDGTFQVFPDAVQVRIIHGAFKYQGDDTDAQRTFTDLKVGLAYQQTPEQWNVKYFSLPVRVPARRDKIYDLYNVTLTVPRERAEPLADHWLLFQLVDRPVDPHATGAYAGEGSYYIHSDPAIFLNLPGNAP